MAYYVGEYRDRVRDGRGAYVFPGGSFRYEGEWKCGKMHGRGVFSLSDGSVYDGEFVNGEITGIGLRRWLDGSTYNGQFQQGERHGEGVHITSSGEVYEGPWVSNQRHGRGELRMVNGDVYRGTFCQHKLHGSGVIKFAKDGSSYDGDWVESRICGRGVLKDTKGATLYDGEWLNGERCGRGAGRVRGVDGGTSEVVYDGVWTDDSPLLPTTKLSFKLIVPRPQVADSEDSKGDGSAQVEYEDAPAIFTLAKKSGFTLPWLAVASLHESQQHEHSIVAGESGRRLRLRVFEGPAPVPVTPAPQDGDTDIVSPPHPAQWYFTPAAELLPLLGETQPLVEAEQVATAPELPVTEEVKLSEVEGINSRGVVFFEKLAMPLTSLLGSYHIVCENLAGDRDIGLASVSLQLVE